MSAYQGSILTEAEVQLLNTLEQLTGSPAEQVSLENFYKTAHGGSPYIPIKVCYSIENGRLIALAIYQSPISELPPNFSGLTSLRQLTFYNLTNLTSLPDSIGEITTLEDLSVEDCRKLVEIPSTIGNLTRLRNLNLAGLNTVELIPESLGYLISLQQLFLNNNRNLLELPESIGNLTSLRILYMQDCKSISNLPYSMENLVNLERLALANTSITELPEFLVNFVSLTDLDLSGMEITALPDWMAKMKSLESLKLSKMQLTTVPDWLENLTSLKNLDLSRNPLTSLPESLEGLKSLRWLDLVNCSFTSIPPVVLKLEHLESLRMRDNPLSGEDLDVYKDTLDAIREYLRKKQYLSIFLSYAIEEHTSALVPRIAEWLETQPGIYKVWYCERDMVGNIDGEMVESVKESDLFLFLATNKSVFSSPDCGFEIENANKNSLSIIPLKTTEVEWADLENVGLPIKLGKALNQTEGEGFETFLKDLYDTVIQFKRKEIKTIVKTKEIINLESDIKTFTRMFFETRAFSKLVAKEKLELKELINKAIISKTSKNQYWKKLFDIFIRVDG